MRIHVAARTRYRDHASMPWGGAGWPWEFVGHRLFLDHVYHAQGKPEINRPATSAHFTSGFQRMKRAVEVRRDFQARRRWARGCRCRRPTASVDPSVGGRCERRCSGRPSHCERRWRRWESPGGGTFSPPARPEVTPHRGLVSRDVENDDAAPVGGESERHGDRRRPAWPQDPAPWRGRSGAPPQTFVVARG
jgi:hypothetical protein